MTNLGRMPFFKRSATFVVLISFVLATSAFAQTATNYEVELAVSTGKKKAVETDAVLTFGPTAFSVIPDKPAFKSASKEMAYADLKSADHSYSKKPMLSGGGAIATAVLLGIFVLPFLFVKKKKHWMTVQTEKEFVVIKLGDNNFRQIVAEFETHGVKVTDLKEEAK